MEFKKPPRLQKGDKIAVISPSSGLAHCFPQVLDRGLSCMKRIFQLQPVEYSSTRRSSNYLSKHPKVRAEDLNRAFADPSIKGVICSIGGDDQIRILPYLNEKVISSSPKIFMGYSDATNLHLFLWRLGIISYYGGAVMTQFGRIGGMDEFTIQAIKAALFHDEIGEIKPSEEWSDFDLDWSKKSDSKESIPRYKSKGWIWHQPQKGVIIGRLWGGCLETLYLHLASKKYLPRFDQSDDLILFIETSEEMPKDSMVYKFISALGEMNILKLFKAILVGRPKTQFLGHSPYEGKESYMENQRLAIKRGLNDYNCPSLPVIFDINFGHTDPQTILPSGKKVTIDCQRKKIFL